MTSRQERMVGTTRPDASAVCERSLLRRVNHVKRDSKSAR
jgi:hypothetical protein